MLPSGVPDCTSNLVPNKKVPTPSRETFTERTRPRWGARNLKGATVLTPAVEDRTITFKLLGGFELLKVIHVRNLLGEMHLHLNPQHGVQTPRLETAHATREGT